MRQGDEPLAVHGQDRGAQLIRLAEVLELPSDGNVLHLLNRATTTAAWTSRYGGVCNESDEFFGDRVWNHAILELLRDLFPKETRPLVFEGWRMQLMAGAEQMRLAKELELEPLLRVPEDHIPEQYGRKLSTMDTLLGNALEAIIGAIATWSIPQALRVARALLARVKTRLRPRTATFIQSHGRRNLEIGSVEQFFGYTRLEMFMARALLDCRKSLTMYGWHALGERFLSVYSLSRMARELGLADATHTDIEAMQRLLAEAGKERKLDERTKDLMRRFVERLKREMMSERGFVSVSDQEDLAASQLSTLLNGRARGFFQHRFRGGGAERLVETVCWVEGRALGRAIARSLAKARETAAMAALNSPELDAVLRRTH